MKKFNILFALLVVFFLASCDDAVRKVENPEKTTTIEIQEHLPKDSVVIAKSENIFYVLNDENLVEYKLVGQNGHNSLMLFLVVAFGFIGGAVGFAIGDTVGSNRRW